MAEEEPDYSSLPITERAVHKIWKVRKEAYEDAAKQFERSADEADACFTPWMMDPYLWKKVVMDSNVAAQQEGITALCAFLKYGGLSGVTRTRSHTIGPLVEKGLTSARAATKASATEAILLYVELDTPGPVMEELIPFFSHKMAKIIAATLTVTTSVYAAFGARTVDPKAVLKVLPKVFAHADKNVRAESTKLAIELYKWLKDAMKPMFFGELKPVQQKELEEAFVKVKDEQPKQERLLKSQKEAQATVDAGGGGGGDGGAEEPEELDAYDLAEPVDINSKLPEGFEENIASTKWKDRKETLDALLTALSVPRIKEGHYDNIVRPLAKCMKDANVAVVTVAANCIEAMAVGMRRGFARYKGVVLSSILDRLKEKKQSVVDALAKALDAVFTSVNLNDILEDVAEYSKNKNPNVKLETVKFLVRALSTTRNFPTPAEQKLIADTTGKLLTESSAPIREAAAEAMGTLMKIIGERRMGPYLDGLDDIRKNKIKEYSDKAQVKAKEKPKAAPTPTAKAGPPSKKLGARPGLKGPGMKKPAAPTPAAPAAPAAVPPAADPPAPRAIPSKLGGPKAPSGLRLKKPAGVGGLASPKRSAMPPPPAARSPSPVHEPAPPAQSQSRMGVGRGLGGLAGRPLSKEAAAPTPATPRADPGLSAADKAELEALRTEKERWEKQRQEEKLEKARMAQEINDLQLQNAQLIEEHTRDNLAIRAKEAQLVRARADAEAAQEEVAKQKREIERLKRELQRSVRPTSPAPTDISEHIMNGLARDNGTHSRNRLSYASTSLSSEEKENGGLTVRESARSPPLRGSESGRASAASGSGENIESWKRAAEVTSQLKMRIEQMKAKQNMGRNSATGSKGY